MTNPITTGNFPLLTGTSAAFAALATALPQGIYCLESDTNGAKISDGQALYANLPYHIPPGGAAAKVSQLTNDVGYITNTNAVEMAIALGG